MTFGPLAATTYTVNGVPFGMVRLPPGRFMDGESRARREILVSRPFEIGINLVTQALWRSVTGSSPASFKAEDRPVEMVSHDDIQAFLARLPDLGLTGFRLPTEAEWAWAARCGAPTWWVGSNRGKPVAVVDTKRTEAVAGLHSGSSGTFDQSGNVMEWSEDRHQGSPAFGIDPRSPASGSAHVSRGGSWYSAPELARVPIRGMSSPGYRFYGLGFRLLRAVS